MSGVRIGGVAGRLSGFTVSVLLVTVVGVISIPWLTASVGVNSWGKLALIQATAQFGGMVVAFGWGAVGAATIAGLPPERRPAAFRRSLQARSLLYALVFPVLASLLVALIGGDVLVTVLGTAVYLLPYLGANWYFTGEGRPRRLLLFDTAPAMGGTLLGLVGASVSNELWIYLLWQGIGYAVAVMASAVVVLRSPQEPDFADHTPLKTLLANQRHAVSATLVSGLYVTLPMIVVQAFLPALQPMYAMADRLFKYASIAFLPIQQFFQSWVPGNDIRRRRRMRMASLWAIGIGVIAGGLIAVLSPSASILLSGGSNVVPLQVSLPLGVAFIGIATASVVGYACLVALGRVRTLAVSTVTGAAVGAPLIFLSGLIGSVQAIAWAVALSELCVAGYQLSVLRVALGRREGEDADE